MANPTNLSEYYASQGQALPSVQQRSGLASKAGIEGYKGTAEQNVKLLGYLQSNGLGNTPTIPTIPIQTATTPQTTIDLPNTPIPEQPSTVYSNASAYLASLPKTGVAGLDQTLEAIQNRPGQLANEYKVQEKQTKANELQKKLDLFNEEYRVLEEKVRTSGAIGAEVANARINELERKRAFTAGTYAIEAAAANQDYQGAKELMNQQVQLELEPLKMRYNFFKDLYDRTEDQRFRKLMAKEERDYQNGLINGQEANDLAIASMEAEDQLGNILGNKAIKIGEGTRTAIGNVLSVVQVAKAFANKNKEGIFPGLSLIRKPAKLASENELQNRQAVEAINLRVQNWASGASLTDQQTKQVERLTPQKSDSDREIRRKLNGLIDFMYADVQGKLGSYGVNSFNPPESKLFDDPLGIFPPIISPGAGNPLGLTL